MFYFIIIGLCDHVLGADLAKQRSSYFLTSDIPWQTQILKLYKTKLRLPTIIELGLDRALIKSKTMKTDSRFQEGLTKNVQWSLNHQEDRTQKKVHYGLNSRKKVYLTENILLQDLIQSSWGKLFQ